MSAFNEVAESIVEHAVALTRLDRREQPARRWQAMFDEHVHAIRLLAAPHLAAGVDRSFLKALQRTAQRADGVFVHLPGDEVELLVDTRAGQLRFTLWSPARLREGR
ncbi:hypothetical protein [Lysobacter humi (ex Lee et al. 2017)]